MLVLLTSSRAAGRHVLYIGLGSMLGTIMKPEEATRVLQVMAEGVELLQQDHPCCAIIHCSTGGGGCILLCVCEGGGRCLMYAGLNSVFVYE